MAVLHPVVNNLAGFTRQKMKFSIKEFSGKCDQIRRKLRIWSHLQEKSLMENFIFCAVYVRLMRLLKSKILTRLYIVIKNILFPFFRIFFFQTFFHSNAQLFLFVLLSDHNQVLEMNS